MEIFAAGCIATLKNGEEVLITENPKVFYDNLDETFEASLRIAKEHKEIDPSVELKPIFGRGSMDYIKF